MPVRPKCMRVSFSLRVTVAMFMGVSVTMTLTGLSHCVAARVAIVAMIMAMRWGRYRRFRNPALFADFRLLGHLVIVLVAPSLGVSDEPSQRGFIHVAGERDLRVAHAHRPRVLRLPCRRYRLSIMMAVSSGCDSKGGDDAGCSSTALWTRFLLRGFAQRRQHFEGEVTRRAVVFIEWHTAPLVYSIAVGACGKSVQSSGS